MENNQSQCSLPAEFVNISCIISQKLLYGLMALGLLLSKIFLKMKKVIRYGIVALVLLVCGTSCKQEKEVIESVTPKEIIANVHGSLKERMKKNFHRLETGRYVPDSIYEIPNRKYHDQSISSL